MRDGESDRSGTIVVHASLGALARAAVTHERYPSSPAFDLAFGAAGAAATEIALELGARAEITCSTTTVACARHRGRRAPACTDAG
jgi:hypothetical protein